MPIFKITATQDVRTTHEFYVEAQPPATPMLISRACQTWAMSQAAYRRTKRILTVKCARWRRSRQSPPRLGF